MYHLLTKNPQLRTCPPYVPIGNHRYGRRAVGPNDKIPPQPPIPIVMPRRAMATYAAFADGYSSAVISRAIVENKYQRKGITVKKKN